MSKTKVITSLLLAMAVLFAQVGLVAAAPLAQEGTTTTINGTIDEIRTDLDENGETIVIVTLTDDQGATQIITLSAQEAADNGLFDLTTQELLVQAGESRELVVDPNDVVPAEEEPAEDVHPIAAVLAQFFDEEPSVVNEYHLDGFGFGVIAQAMWMSRNLTGTEEEVGDASLAGDILEAKRDKDFETFFMEHEEFGEVFGDEMPTNWGQFKKVLKEKKQNLGVIVSGQAEDDTQDPTLQENPGQQNQGNDKPEKQKKPKKQKKH
jgi:hypothetical protein